MTDTYEPLAVTSPRGVSVSLLVRPGTNDAATLHSTFRWQGNVTDEYDIADLYVSGWALDVGAHIGSVAIALALDNPELRVIAIEAVPDNADLLRMNAERAGVDGRVISYNRAATRRMGRNVQVAYGRYDGDPHQQSVYIGDTRASGPQRGSYASVGPATLRWLLLIRGIDRVAFMKIDCEGCEWGFLDSPAIGLVDLIHGEYHDRGAAAIIELLSPTHDVTITHEDGGFGLFRAVVK